MPTVPAGVLTDLRNLVSRSLTDTATIARTNATLPCRIMADTREIHLDGLPSTLRLRRWRIVFANGADVRLSDTITATGFGTYTVMEVIQPRSEATSVTCYCVQTSTPTSTFPILTNAQVTFQRTTGNGVTVYPATGTTGVYVLRRDQIREPMPWMLAYPWLVLFDATATFTGTDAGVIRAGDEIIWSELNNGRASLQKVLKVYGPLVYCMAGFSEVE